MRSDASHRRWRRVLGAFGIAFGAAPIAFLLIRLMGIETPWFWPAVLLVVLCIIAIIQLFLAVVPDSVGAAVQTFLMPRDSGPRTIAYSHAQAMAVRGETVAASDEFRRLMATAPDDVALHRAAAEFFVKADASFAATVFQRLRQLPLATAEDEHYATHRLIDLYGGTLRNTGRMRVELRRLVERFPGTVDAAGAEAALKRMRDEADR